jgi:outer membrane protein assembly factor BamB
MLRGFCNCLCLALVTALILLPGVARAQVGSPAQFQQLQQALAGGALESNTGVYVRDSALALEKIALAQRMERLGEWNKSADIYQEIIEKYRDRVVPSHVDDQGVTDQYTSVVNSVTQRLCNWPAEGLAIYRARYEVTAERLVKSATDAQANGSSLDLRSLHEAFAQYFITDAGKQAGLKLVDAYFELGDFAAAQWTAEQLLLHPSLGPDRPKVLFRLGLSAHLTGEDNVAKQAALELKSQFPNAVATIAGQQTALADELAADLQTVQGVSYAAAVDSWMTAGGDASRGKVSSAQAGCGARLYTIDLPQPDWKITADPQTRKNLEVQSQTWRQKGSCLGVMPVADRGELFFQDNASVYAIDLDSGTPLPGWLSTYPDHNGQFVFPDARPLANGHQFCLTLTESDVLAVMDLPDPLAMLDGLADQGSARLVCLDRQTGKLLWKIAAAELPDDNLQHLTLGGSPLVMGNNVYLVGRAPKPNGFEDCYVLCFDLATGAYRWSSYVASATSGVTPWMNAQFGQLVLGDSSTSLAYASGRLFVATNLGAVAALDADTGTIAWLDIYRDASSAFDPYRNAGMMPGFNPGFIQNQNGLPPPSPWTISAPIVRNGHLFVLPADGKNILVYDAGNGELVKSLSKSDCCVAGSDEAVDPSAPDLAQPNTLLAVLGMPVKSAAAPHRDSGDLSDQLLLVATPNRVCAIDWRKYDSDNPREAIVWVSTPCRAQQPIDTIRGRAYVSADDVYVSATFAFCRVAVRNGLIVETYPPGADSVWNDDEEPGNILVCGDHLVIAGAKRVAVYADLAVARAKLDEEAAEVPSDPIPLLHYAEVMCQARQWKLAKDKLLQAVALLTGEDTQARDRAFNDALDFAIKQRRVDGNADEINTLFDQAAGLASNPSQQVAYRMARARFASSTGPQPHLALAVRLYQEILARPDFRTAPIPAPQQKPAHAPSESSPSDNQNPDQTDASLSLDQAEPVAQAGLAARAEIAGILLNPQGAAAYAPYEQSAKNKMATAASDPSALLEVAMEYPNSKIATAAESAAANLFEARNEPRAATRVLRDLYMNDNVRTPAVLEALARNYLKTGRFDAAVSRLDQAMTLSPDGAMLDQPLALPDGTILKDMPIKEAANRVSLFVTHVAETGSYGAQYLPDFHLPPHQQRKLGEQTAPTEPPLAEDTSAAVDNIGKLVPSSPDFSRGDRLVAWTDGSGLSIYAAGKSKPLGSDSDLSDEPRGIAWTGDDLLAWTTSTIAQVDGRKAASRWKLNLAGLPTLEVLAQAVPDISANSPMDDYYVQRQLRRARMQAMRGVNRFRSIVPPPQMALPQTVPPQVQVVEQTSVAETITNVIPTSDLAILATTTGRVAAVDLSTGSVAWQTRLTDHGVDRILANDDFTVIKTTDESVVQLIVLDTASGRMLARKAFSIEGGAYPINIAMSDDGLLAFTLPDRVVIHNLFEVGGDPHLQQSQVSSPAQVDSPLMFQNMNRPDQLLIHVGKVLALSDDGKFLRGFRAGTGEALQYYSHKDQDTEAAPMVLSAGDGGQETHLRISGSYVYAWSENSIAAYNIDHPDFSWAESNFDLGLADDLLLGKDYALLVNHDQGISPPTDYWILAFSRALLPKAVNRPVTTESGLWVYPNGARPYTPTASDPSGILAWQPVDGGLYYLAGDHRLHFLRGTRTP